MVNDIVLDAEKFRADVIKPKGTKDIPYFPGVRQNEGQVLEDDEFIHITCHVEKGLVEKISRGGVC